MKSVALVVWLLLLSPLMAAEPPQTATAPNTARTDGEIAVRILSWDEVQTLVDSHKGQVVVVDLWSTYCPPCVREFPNLVKLQSDHADDVVCISVNVNYAGIKKSPPESLREPVTAFLHKKGAVRENVICSTPDLDVFEAAELASIPAVYVYGRDGQLAKRFDNDNIQSDDDEFTYEKDVLPLVRKLMNKKK